MNPRVRRVMKLVDLDAARSPEARALRVTVTGRIDQLMSGEAKTYSVAEATRYVRDRLEAAQLRTRETFLDAVVQDFEAMRTDAVAWNDELEERDAWTTTLGDGLS